MHLSEAVARMSHVKVAPEGLKPQECERNVGRSKSLIPNIPKKDEVQEAVDSSANMLKLLLPHQVELHVPLWLKGTPEQFLVHIQQALDAITQKGLETALEKAVQDKEELNQKLQEATEALAHYKGNDENPPEKKAVQKANEAVVPIRHHGQGCAGRLVIPATLTVSDDKMCQAKEILIMHENCVVIFLWCVDPGMMSTDA